MLVSAIAIAGCQRFLEFQNVHVDLTDASTGGPPQLLVQKTGHTGSGALMQTLTLSIPPADRTVLLVDVGLSGDANFAPVIETISFAGLPLTFIDRAMGVPTQPTTVSELWQMVAPPAGNNEMVQITLSSPGLSFHAGAFVFEAVDQTAPVRSSVPGSGRGSAATGTIASMPGDTVLGVVGAGSAITLTDGAQELYKDNVSSAYTLDNSSASTAPGADSVTISWTLAQLDNWQTMLVSLRP